MIVKICGVTHPEDAKAAAQFGADFIGMTFFAGSKRNVSIPEAAQIAKAAKEAGAEPVGVFVDQSAGQIAAVCEQTGMKEFSCMEHPVKR